MKQYFQRRFAPFWALMIFILFSAVYTFNGGKLPFQSDDSECFASNYDFSSRHCNDVRKNIFASTILPKKGFTPDKINLKAKDGPLEFGTMEYYEYVSSGYVGSKNKIINHYDAKAPVIIKNPKFGNAKLKALVFINDRLNTKKVESASYYESSIALPLLMIDSALDQKGRANEFEVHYVSCTYRPLIKNEQGFMDSDIGQSLFMNTGLKNTNIPVKIRFYQSQTDPLQAKTVFKSVVDQIKDYAQEPYSRANSDYCNQILFLDSKNRPLTAFMHFNPDSSVIDIDFEEAYRKLRESRLRSKPHHRTASFETTINEIYLAKAIEKTINFNLVSKSTNWDEYSGQRDLSGLVFPRAGSQKSRITDVDIKSLKLRDTLQEIIDEAQIIIPKAISASKELIKDVADQSNISNSDKQEFKDLVGD